jgi:hypothetical protein
MISGIFGGALRGLGGGNGSGGIAGRGIMRRLITSFAAPENLVCPLAIAILLAIVIVLIGLTVREYTLWKKK